MSEMNAPLIPRGTKWGERKADTRSNLSARRANQ